MSDKMVKCKTCGAEIAKSAKTCPKCGAKQKKSKVLGIVLLCNHMYNGIVVTQKGGWICHHVQEDLPQTPEKEQGSWNCSGCVGLNYFLRCYR